MQKEIQCPLCSELVKPEDIKLGYHRSGCDKEFSEDFIDFIEEQRLLDYFILDFEELRLFYSLQYYLTNKDIRNTDDPEKKKKKKS